MAIATKHAIDLHKGCTWLFVLGVMAWFDEFGVGAWIYLALHGTYGLLWLIKSRAFPDPEWEERVPAWQAGVTFVIMAAYWLAPVVLVHSGATPPAGLLALCVSLCVAGMVLHFGASAQRSFVQRERGGDALVTDGFFARTRHIDLLGEILLYAGLATLTMNWLPWIVLAVLFVPALATLMRARERAMAELPQWRAYRARSGMLLPRIFRRELEQHKSRD